MIASTLRGDDPPTSASSSSRSGGHSSFSELEAHPEGSLAMLQKADDERSERSGDNQPGSTAAAPIDFTADDDFDEEDGTESIDTSRSPQPQAGPSRQPLFSPDKLLFSEKLSVHQSGSTINPFGLPTPPDSQELIKPPASNGTAAQRLLSRPDVRNVPLASRTKGWEIRASSRSASPTSSTSSRRSTTLTYSRRPKKHRSNLRSEEFIRVKKLSHMMSNLKRTGEQEGNVKVASAAERVKKMLAGHGAGVRPGIAFEAARRTLVTAGLNDKETFAAMLGARRPVTLDEKTTKKTPIFQVLDKQKVSRAALEVAKRESAFELSDILKALKEEQALKEAEIVKRLQPKLPDSLSPEQEAKVKHHLSNGTFKASIKTAEVTANSLRRLKPSTWLDDEVMNFYCAMMTERAAADGAKRVHNMNSFFFAKLEKTGYQSVRRWTKKVDIFALDYFVFPINMDNMHWTACAVNFEKKRIEYYDSMGDYSRKRNTRVREYLQAEHKEKKGTPFDLTGWSDEFNENTPQQDNGSDCGVFSCQTLEMISRGRDLVSNGFEFTARNMAFFRRLMVYEIGEKELLKRDWGSPKL
ncbi:hypothetical protein I316_05198 [Kwoniella heveanensis BCC8398]|uniref:Ubiquitin-like protease family profile domain-containing protein n=1 Tax=Kwoniella heveanensis BCC8398 TaxID=1296120 RepID=A0A1B9GQ66_9TREE|nr:hypothetical protein I316_05198 [Kwoniella heveanensis BCC8398]